MAPPSLPPSALPFDIRAQIIDNCKFILGEDDFIRVITSVTKLSRGDLFRSIAFRFNAQIRCPFLESNLCDSAEKAVESLLTKSSLAVENYLELNGFTTPYKLREPSLSPSIDDGDDASIISMLSDLSCLSRWASTDEEVNKPHDHTAGGGDKAHSERQYLSHGHRSSRNKVALGAAADVTYEPEGALPTTEHIEDIRDLNLTCPIPTPPHDRHGHSRSPPVVASRMILTPPPRGPPRTCISLDERLTTTLSPTTRASIPIPPSQLPPVPVGPRNPYQQRYIDPHWPLYPLDAGKNLYNFSTLTDYPVRLTVTWVGHGQHHLLTRCLPTRESLQSAAVREVRMNPGAFTTNGNGSGNNAGHCNSVRNRDSKGKQAMNNHRERQAMRAHVCQAMFGGEAYDMQTYNGRDFSTLFRVMRANGNNCIPRFEVVVEDVAAPQCGGISLDDAPAPTPATTSTMSAATAAAIANRYDDEFGDEYDDDDRYIKALSFREWESRRRVSQSLAQAIAAGQASPYQAP